MMTLRDLARKFSTELTDFYEAGEAEAIFLIAIESTLNYSRTDYMLNKDEDITMEQVSSLENILDELTTGKPIQYILGETFFYGLPFKVNSSVLIPRPETEELVDFILQVIGGDNKIKPKYLLDIGTGSGCIAIALKKNLPDTKVYGVDISVESLDLAKENAAINHVEVEFETVDILGDTSSISHHKFSIIVSNPPYITTREQEEMHQNVLENEPHHALFVSDEEPLIFYEAIADFALQNLERGGYLFFEINEHLGKETIFLLMGKEFKNIEIRKDIQGKDRMIFCKL